MAALTLRSRRFALAAGSILIAACLSAIAATPPPRAATPNAAADSFRVRTEALFNAGQYDSLAQIASIYARRAASTGDSVLLGRALIQRGRAHIMLRDAGAERDIDAGLRIAESVRDTTGLMPAVHFKGYIYWYQQRYDDAVHCFERRLLLAQMTHSPLDEAWARASLGYSFHNLGDQDRAWREYKRALELFHAGGKKRLEVEPLIGLGRVESARGHGPESIQWYRKALVAAHETGDRMNEMWAANNLAAMETLQGDLSLASAYLQHAVALARELKSPYGLVVPATNLANGFRDLGDFETAESVLQETRTLCATHWAADQLPLLDYDLAQLRIQEGRNASAAGIMRRLIRNPAALEVQHRDFLFINMASVLASSDSVGAAIDLLSAYLRVPGHPVYGEAGPTANLVLGNLYAQSGDTHRALESARRAHAAAIPTGQKRALVAAMFLESKCCHDLGDDKLASTVFYASLDSMDAARGGISTPEWREVYGQWVSQDVIETGRVLLEYPPTISRLERERAFFDSIQRVKTRALLDRINRPRNESQDAGPPSTPHVATLAELQSRLRQGEVVLDFCVGVHRSFLAAVTADSLRLVELPGPTSSLGERVQLLRTVLASTDPALRKEYDVKRLSEVQRSIGHDILGGVTDLIERSSYVFVSPDGYFSAVPFGLLIAGESNGALMQDHDVVQIPSASVLVMERSRQNGDANRAFRLATVSVSGPGLSGARAEVEDLAHHYRHVDHFADPGNLEAFKEAVTHGDVLHIASHALVIDRSPWWSGIQLRADQHATPATERGSHEFLSDTDSLSIERAFPSDSYVRAWQIAQLNIPARLAVLSACETAGGRMTTGEGTLGLTGAFLSAGVPVVVSSLWPVDDRATAIIMRSFYRNLAAGQSVATALRHAQLDASHIARYAHPFYWSGFTVVGDGGRKIPIQKRLLTWSSLASVSAGLFFVAAIGFLIRHRRARAFVG